MNRLSLFLVLLFALSPLKAQQEVVALNDSLDHEREIVADTVLVDSILSDSLLDNQLPIDSIDTDSLVMDLLVEDSVEVVPEPEFQPQPYTAQALLAVWRHLIPLSLPSDSMLRATEATYRQSSELQQLVDSLPFDSSLVYAQRDLRMPLYMDGNVPQPNRQRLGEVAQEQCTMATSYGLDFVNPYPKQLDYAAIRTLAIYQFSLMHMRSITRFRSGNSDLPTERRYIERQALSGNEMVDTGLGLELETASLSFEQITFHADKWHRKGTTDLQISQTALSENWYKGGDNNMTISNYDKLVFSRYDESMKTTLDITLELRLSTYYTKADTVHPMRVNDNQFRVDVSYGYKAWKNWYYSTTGYMKTPIFEYFNSNSKVVKNTFFSPLELNLAVGMDLKLNKKKNFSYSLMVAPLSYNIKCVADDRVNETSYGLKEGKTSLHQVGASVTSKMEWKMNDAVNWTSRAYFFTSYHNALFEFENTFNVVLGRYSTAKIYLYPRFDDSVDDSWQMKEILTFGLAFTW